MEPRSGYLHPWRDIPWKGVAEMMHCEETQRVVSVADEGHPPLGMPVKQKGVTCR